MMARVRSIIPTSTQHFLNKNTSGGGVALLHNRFQESLYQSISFQFSHTESLFIQITKPHKFLVGMLYRPPNGRTDEYLLSLENILEVVFGSECAVQCYGGSVEPQASQCSESCEPSLCALGLPAIPEPARVTNTSATLIDHIRTNDLQHYTTRGILHSSFSDHFPVFSSVSTRSSASYNHTIVKNNLMRIRLRNSKLT